MAEFYATCKELSIDTEPAVLGLLEDMVEDDDNDLTEKRSIVDSQISYYAKSDREGACQPFYP